MPLQRPSERLYQEIKHELDNFDNLSDKDKEIILKVIDQKVADLSILLFRDLNRDYDELQRISKTIKAAVRDALAKEFKDPTQTALQIIGGVAAIGGGFAAGGGLIAGGNQGIMVMKLGKLAMSGSQGFSLIDKVPESFSQATKTVLQDQKENAQSEISNEEEWKREVRQATNEQTRRRQERDSSEHSTFREMSGRG